MLMVARLLACSSLYTIEPDRLHGETESACNDRGGPALARRRMRRRPLRAMQLKSLIGPEISAPAGCGEIEISGITADSREVRPGWLFAALPGAKADGDALRAGGSRQGRGRHPRQARAPRSPVPEGVAVLRAAEPRRALALMAARFYPGQPETIVAVTGTSGKTSVADFARQIFAQLGRKAASLGTIGLVKPDGSVYGGLTTPDPISAAQDAGRAGGRGRHAPGLRGLLARPRPAPARRRPAEGRGLHQPRPRPSRLSPEHGGLPRRQAAPVHGAAAAGRHRRRQCRCGARRAGDRRGARQRARPSSPSARAATTLKLESLARDGFAQALRVAHGGQHLRHPPAAAGRLPGVERAAGGRPRHRRRRAGRPRAAGAGRAQGREGPAGDRGAGARRPRSSSTTRTSRMRWRPR